MPRFDPDEARTAPLLDPARRPARDPATLGHGTLACPRCDAPVALPAPSSPGRATTCPYCAHAGSLGSFVSLRAPTRPTRVVIRVTARAGLAVSRAA